ncbi:MAG: CapA family protein [Patescibacteria group bacterium]
MNTKQGKIRWLLLLTLAMVAFLGTTSYYLKNLIYKEANQLADVSAAPVLASTDTGPKYFYFNKEAALLPKVSATAFLVGDLDTGEVIMEKNQDTQLPIASVSKLMTALVANELGGEKNEEGEAQVSKKALATYGGNGAFHLGEKIKVNELFYPLLLESSNDAAEILAEYFGRDTFLSKMNQEAQILQMSSTTYDDPSGLSPNNKSTVSDLFKLAGFLSKQKQNILDITTKRSYTNDKHNWSSNNQFLREAGYEGGKSGFTDPAKQTVISIFSVPLPPGGERNIAITLLGSNDRHKDVDNIVSYLKKNIYYGGEADANIAWVKQKDGIPEIKDPDFVTLSFVGDIMVDRGVKNSVMNNFGGDYSALFDKMGTLKDSDVVFANLEGTASDKGEDQGNLYSFQMDPTIIPALRGAGVSILSVANNHVGDFGRESYIDTLSRLRENEITYTGGGMNSEEAEQPAVMEKYGIKLGFLGFSDVGPDWMNAKEDTAGLLLASNPRFDQIIKNAASQVDDLIVSFHWGVEYQTQHNARQEELAHKAIDDGAKIIIGTHPHVMEDTETYKNGYIAYSLGNFIFDQIFSAETMKGMLLNIKLGHDGSLAVTKNTVRLNDAFQPDTVVAGKEEKIKFDSVLIPN